MRNLATNKVSHRNMLLCYLLYTTSVALLSILSCSAHNIDKSHTISNRNHSFYTESSLQSINYNKTTKITEMSDMLKNLLQYKERNKARIEDDKLNDIFWVRNKLSSMVNLDQKSRNLLLYMMRNDLTLAEKSYFEKVVLPEIQEIDVEHGKELKYLLKKYTWFVISKFGKKADKEAWLLIQHQDCDINLQKEVLNRLKNLYPMGETDRRNYAYLYDRILVLEDKKQMYGTQGYCNNGIWVPNPMISAERIDDIRKSMNLSTMKQYKKLVSTLCH